ncbi:avidin-related protein 7-like isoform X2 [Passer domesticus]|uniref:avidin-related protein 7-like isoform X2 n=1 Tax=Passer domesticus TaxID=48849 RepID=UPI0030FE4479
MVQATPLLLVLFLALGAHSLQGTQQCKLTGKWKNDLGSNMTISEINGDGDFNGTYFTATSASPGPIKESPLVGSQQLPYASQPTFGFTVHWSFSNTITVFMGQCFVDKHGKEVLKTMWLLRLHSDKLANNWNATLAGYDTFWRLEELKD